MTCAQVADLNVSTSEGPSVNAIQPIQELVAMCSE
jgi:hypothetical protein